MKCLKKEKIRTFIDHELTLSETKRVKRHISECSYCQNTLQKVGEEIKLTQRKIELLNPETVPEHSPCLLGEREERKCQFTFKKFILSPIRVPAVVLVFIISLVLVMSFMLFAKNLREVSPRYLQSPEAKKNTMNFIMEDFVQSISLSVESEEMKPIENPRIFVLKELEK